MHKQQLVLQGQAEATEIRISGKLPGRIDTFFVQEGDWPSVSVIGTEAFSPKSKVDGVAVNL